MHILTSFIESFFVNSLISLKILKRKMYLDISNCLLIIHEYNYFWFSVCYFLSRCHEHVSGVWMKNGYDFLPPFGEEAGQILQLRGINSRYPCTKYSFGCTGLRLDGLSEIIRWDDYSKQLKHFVLPENRSYWNKIYIMLSRYMIIIFI